jgi:Phosphoserine phosphatase RsbU, N-terminal domain
MSGSRASFSRRYRAALLDYLMGRSSGELGLARAYGLGRRAIDDGLGLTQIWRAHRMAIDAVLESTHPVSESLSRLKAAEDFLMETLSPFEMTHRGYVALLQLTARKRKKGSPGRSSVRVARR